MVMNSEPLTTTLTKLPAPHAPPPVRPGVLYRIEAGQDGTLILQPAAPGGRHWHVEFTTVNDAGERPGVFKSSPAVFSFF